MIASHYPAIVHYADLIGLLSLILCLIFAILLARHEREVHRLTSAGLQDDKSSDEGGTQASHTMQRMGETEWDELTWEEKMSYEKKRKQLNWTAVVFGALTFVSIFGVSYANLVLDVDGILSLPVLIIAGALILLLGGYLVWNYKKQWQEVDAPEKAMQTSVHKSSFGQWIAIVVVVFILGGLLGAQALPAVLIIVAVIFYFFILKDSGNTTE